MSQQDGTVVAVKCLKDASDASVSKFRREVFLFEALTGKADGSQCASQELGTGRLAAELDPRSLFVQLLAHSPLQVCSIEDANYSVLEFGHFTMHDLVGHCKDAARWGKSHCLEREGELLRASLHIFRALAFLASRQFAHGDVKPANVMWFSSEAGVWKLIDLDGLRTHSELVDMLSEEFYTPIYAAPELAAAVAAQGPLRITGQLDVWSAGVTLLELEMLRPPLWEKFEECCRDQEDGLPSFMRWLGDEPEPVPLPVVPKIACPAFWQLLRSSVLVRQPLGRQPPSELLRHRLFSEAELGRLPPPSLQPEEAPAAANRPKTAWQLFQDEHSADLEQQGLKGGKLLAELHRQWKKLQAEGGEELKALREREAELRACALTATCSGT